MKSLRVAVIGTGRMGSAMARRLVAGGFDTVVWNRTISRATDLAAGHDVTVAPSAAAAVHEANIAVVSLADDNAANETYAGPQGVLAGAHDDLVITDTSTLSPHTVQSLAHDAERTGATLLDTPVSGSVSTVDAGQLTLMAGGSTDALARAEPALSTFAARIVHLGGIGTGAAMKLAVNSILHALNVALCEGLVLAERAGIDRATAYDVIASGAAGAPFVHYKRDSFVDPDSQPVAFSLDLVAKDLALISDLADDLLVESLQLDANQQLVALALAQGLGSADMSALAGMLRDQQQITR